MRKLANDIHRLFIITILVKLLIAITIYNSYPMRARQNSLMFLWIWNRQYFPKGTREEKVVALSFDDGPHPKYTIEILDILKEYDIKATFFVTRYPCRKNTEIIKRQVEEGHEEVATIPIHI